MPHKKPAVSAAPAPPAVRALRTGDAYARMIAAPPAKRADVYRHELMAAFKAKWDCYRVPLRPAQPGGYDVVMASEMLGILPPARVDGSWDVAVRCLADDDLWRASRQASSARSPASSSAASSCACRTTCSPSCWATPTTPRWPRATATAATAASPVTCWRGSCPATTPCAGCPPRSRTRRTTTCASNSSLGATTSPSAR